MLDDRREPPSSEYRRGALQDHERVASAVAFAGVPESDRRGPELCGATVERLDSVSQRAERLGWDAEYTAAEGGLRFADSLGPGVRFRRRPRSLPSRFCVQRALRGPDAARVRVWPRLAVDQPLAA
jgi:hypothetical protein